MSISNQIRHHLFLALMTLGTLAISAHAEENNKKPVAKAAAAAPAAHAAAPAPAPAAAQANQAPAARASQAIIPGARTINPEQNAHVAGRNDAVRNEAIRNDRGAIGERRDAGVERRGVGMEHREAIREHHEFHGRDFNHFDRAEQGRWRGGRWNNTCYAGRCGWWWFTSGQWYFYDRPVYPYPVAISEVTFLEPVATVAVVPVMNVQQVQQAPSAPPAPLPPAPQFWYYCDNPAGYYPNVPTCSSGFHEVAAPRH